MIFLKIKNYTINKCAQERNVLKEVYLEKVIHMSKNLHVKKYMLNLHVLNPKVCVQKV